MYLLHPGCSLLQPVTFYIEHHGVIDHGHCTPPLLMSVIFRGVGRRPNAAYTVKWQFLESLSACCLSCRPGATVFNRTIVKFGIHVSY